jgi:hypothetical protein
MEVCTPIMKGWVGLKKVCEVVQAFAVDPKIKIDNRCSVHLHVEVSDLESAELASVIAHWFKVEPIFMDSVPVNRKRNRYCQFMGMTGMIQHDAKFNFADLAKRVGQVKYYSLNTNQMFRNGRKTIEFRIIEGEGVKDPFLIKNWVRLCIHFVEMARRLPFPGPYKENDPWSSLCWLDPEDALRLLGFSNDPQNYELSPGLQQTRHWLLARMDKYMSKEGPRSVARKELAQILERFKEEGNPVLLEKHLTPSDLPDALYNEETRQ